MLTTLELENIQSHEHSEIPLSEGVTTIVGSSDNGKSAIIRALTWAIQNRPLGLGLASTWNCNKKGAIVDTMLVGVTKKDGAQLCRYRTTEANGYTLHNPGEKPIEYEAVRGDIPAEVQKFFNLSQSALQKQFDAPFLIGCTPGEAAQLLSSIVRLEQIDTIQSKALKDKRAYTQQVKSQEIQLQHCTEQIQELAYLDVALSKVKVLADVMDITEERQRDIQVTHNIVAGIVELTASIEERAKLLTEAVGYGTRLEELVETVTKRGRESRILSAVVADIACVEARIQEREAFLAKAVEYSQQLQSLTYSQRELATKQGALKNLVTDIQTSSRYESIPVAKATDTCNLIAAIDLQVRKIGQQHSDLTVRCKSIQRVTNELNEGTKAINKLRTQLPKSCPLCGQPLKEAL